MPRSAPTRARPPHLEAKGRAPLLPQVSGFEVLDEEAGRDRRTGCVLYQLLGRIYPAPPVDLLRHPVAQRLEVTRRDGVLQAGALAPGGVEELRRGDVAERVCGEVTKEAVSPVDVLQPPVEVADIPRVWRQKYKDYLGVH